MADVGEAVVSKGGIHGSNDSIKTFERSVTVHADSSVPDFVHAASNLALTPTALGTLSADISMKAGLALAEKNGRELGKTPEGDLLPAFTKADKAFVDSYSSQAQMTLGLQADQYINKANEELNNSYMLSQGQISAYEKNVAKGLEGILQNAPSTVRDKMNYQYASQLQSHVHQLNNKMISQQKEYATSANAVWRKNQDLQMQNAIYDGNQELASQIYDSIQASIKNGLNTHQLTPLEADTALHAAKLNFLGTQEINQAMQARKNHRLEPFLSNMIESKPAGVDWGDWIKIQNMTVSAVGQVENMDNRNQSLLAAQMQTDSLNGVLDGEKIAYYKENLQPTRFLQTYAPIIARQNKEGRNIQENLRAAGSVQDPSFFAGLSSQKKNSVFDLLVQGQIQDANNKGSHVEEWQAKVLIAKSLPGPIPKYIAELDLKGQSQNPAQIAEAARSIEILDSQAGNALNGLNNRTRRTVEAFQYNKQMGFDDNTAGLNAINTILNKSEEQEKSNRRVISEWQNKFAKTSSQRSNFVKQFISPGSAKIVNAEALNNQLINVYKDLLMEFNGDQVLANSSLEKSVNRMYGLTNINGQEQYTYMPVEKAIGLPDGATPLMHEDVSRQLMPQLEASKEAFKNGTSDFYYEMGDRPSIETYLEAKKKVNSTRNFSSYFKSIAKGISPTTELKNEFKIIAEFESNKPIEIKRIYRDKHVENVRISVDASPYMSITTNESPIIGGYDINEQSDSGHSYALIGPHSGPLNPPVYRPDKKWITERWLALNAPDDHQMQFKNNVELARYLVDKENQKAKESTKYWKSITAGR